MLSLKSWDQITWVSLNSLLYPKLLECLVRYFDVGNKFYNAKTYVRVIHKVVDCVIQVTEIAPSQTALLLFSRVLEVVESWSLVEKPLTSTTCCTSRKLVHWNKGRVRTAHSYEALVLCSGTANCVIPVVDTKNCR